MGGGEGSRGDEAGERAAMLLSRVSDRALNREHTRSIYHRTNSYRSAMVRGEQDQLLLEVQGTGSHSSAIQIRAGAAEQYNKAHNILHLQFFYEPLIFSD
jgi:hypothetical protein